VAYGTTDELARRLTIRSPTPEQTEQLQSVLDAASAEINWDLDYTDDVPTPSPLVVNACYGRARELWNLGYATFGGTLLGTDLLAYAGNDSWLRWHRLLDPLRLHEGIA
jgi:hypothetical protein